MDIKEVESLIHRIKADYSNMEYQRISGDRYLEDVPEKIWRYWYSDGQGSLALCNIDDRFIEAKQGIISMEEFHAMLIDLYDALAQEFEHINKANL